MTAWQVARPPPVSTNDVVNTDVISELNQLIILKPVSLYVEIHGENGDVSQLSFTTMTINLNVLLNKITF
ncbi:unnamed protein product [Timema podura]|uniref:Uncharacterized protein n=1 Tax=Timema podura TaxID=61482 RepID=A0ABN7P628_TIMPD|nr:unnamed protein product [Timema podura]